MAKTRWIDKFFRRTDPKANTQPPSWVRSLVLGSLYKVSDMRGDTAVSNIRTQIDTLRALANDSQIDTTLSYYATDATTVNTAGQIIWATPVDDSKKAQEAAEIVNTLFKRWNINQYARDHILELATIGNLYLPTTELYAEQTNNSKIGVVLDNNTIPNSEYDIIPSYKIPPENIIHIWQKGRPVGFIIDPDEKQDMGQQSHLIVPEEACIHFSLGGLLGDYTISVIDNEGNPQDYDISFATSLIARSVQPTQTLSLLEDAMLLSSLIRTIKFINVECGTEEDEIRDSLQQVKDTIEQQLSLNTSTGDAQSFVNPQSPNNLIYVPKINGQDAISITDLNMSEATESDNKLLDYYQNKKLSTLGIPKEALNFSSSEGLGGAGQVMSQRSALYANSLQRLEVAYMNGWYDALKKYFKARNFNFEGLFELHMNPVVTIQSTVQFDKRDAALNQAQTAVQMLKDLGVVDDESYHQVLIEILSEVFPQMGADAASWDVAVEETTDEGGMGDAF